MDREKREEIYRAAIARYGTVAQKLMAIEEMAELIQALCKDFRGKLNLLNAIEETADVRIMLEQLEVMYQCTEAIQPAMDMKLRRLWDKLQE